jgi:SOS-response transcriptional repressor LexA
MRPLTETQLRVLVFCGEFFAKNDQLPPHRIIADRFGWRSPNSASEVLDMLRQKGHLARNELGKYRLTDRGRSAITEDSSRATWHPTNGISEPTNGNGLSYSAG